MTPAAAAARALHARSVALNARYGLSKKRTAGGLPPVVRPVGAGAPRVAAPLTPAQQAAAVAAQSIDPAKAAVNEQVATMEAARTAHLKAVQGVANALGALTSGDIGASRDAFQQAADRVAAYGKGLSGELGDLQTSAAGKVAALMSALNIEGSVKSGAAANANVTNLLGGVMPASDLAGEAARALTTAQNQRAAAGARLGDDASLADYKSGEEISKVRAQLEEIEAKRPGLIAEALDHLAQQANAKRATDTQIGYLQLQQAKTASEQALAWTNITGTIHTVGKKGKIIDTGRPAAGSDAATIAAQNQRATAANATASANAKLSAATRKEVADASADARRYAADTSAAASKANAATAAAAKTEAARVSAKKAQNKSAQATPQQRATIIKGATASGNDIVKTSRERIWSLIPNTYARGKDEKAEDYEKRRTKATNLFRARLKEHRGEIVNRVAAAIAAQLKVIGYQPDEIRALAEAVVNAQIPR